MRGFDVSRPAIDTFWLAVVGIFPAAWITHIIHCLNEDQWGFLIAGAIAFPIAIIHGIGIWFGVW